MKKIIAILICSLIILNISTYFYLKSIDENHTKVYNYSDFRTLTMDITGYIFDNSENLDDTVVTDEITRMLKVANLELIICDKYGGVVFNNADDRKMLILQEDLFYDNYFSKNNADKIKITDHIVKYEQVQYYEVFIIPNSIIDDYFESLNIDKIMVPIFLLSIIIIIVVLSLYGVYKKNYNEPLHELRKSAQRITKGDWDYSLPDYGKGVIGQCINLFDMMRNEMKSSIEIRNEYEKSKRELIAYISHDLKTPLTIIRGYIEGILDGVGDAKKVEEYNNGIHKKVLSMEKLIQDLFIHSQMELNELIINKKEKYIDVILETIFESISGFIELDERYLIIKRPFAKVLVNIDEARFEQVIVNLISNAIKYTDKDDSISVWTKVDSEGINIYIEDTGRGIGKEELPFIFDKFYRGDRARNTDNAGAGLGLAICKYTIETHGGFIKVESKISKGTTFVISLPIV